MFPREIIDLFVDELDLFSETFCLLPFVSRAFWASSRTQLFRNTVLKYHVGRRSNRSVNLLSRIIQDDPTVLSLIKSFSISFAVDSHYEFQTKIPLSANDPNFPKLLHLIRLGDSLISLEIKTIQTYSYPSTFQASILAPHDLQAIVDLRSIPSLRNFVMRNLRDAPLVLVTGVDGHDPVHNIEILSVTFIEPSDQTGSDQKESAPINPPTLARNPTHLTSLVLDVVNDPLEVLFPPSIEYPSLTSLSIGQLYRLSWNTDECVAEQSKRVAAFIRAAPLLETFRFAPPRTLHPESWKGTDIFQALALSKSLSSVHLSWAPEMGMIERALNSMSSFIKEAPSLPNLKHLALNLHWNASSVITTYAYGVITCLVTDTLPSWQRTFSDNPSVHCLELNFAFTKKPYAFMREDPEILRLESALANFRTPQHRDLIYKYKLDIL